jgi:hypothetical protein
MECTTKILDLGKLKRGDSFMGFKFKLLEDDNLTPISLIGATFLMQLRTSDKSPVAYEFSTANGKIQVIDGFVVIATVLAGFQINPNVYVFDVQFTDNAGVIRTIINGKIEIINDISRLQ